MTRPTGLPSLTSRLALGLLTLGSGALVAGIMVLIALAPAIPPAQAEEYYSSSSSSSTSSTLPYTKTGSSSPCDCIDGVLATSSSSSSSEEGYSSSSSSSSTSSPCDCKGGKSNKTKQF